MNSITLVHNFDPQKCHTVRIVHSASCAAIEAVPIHFIKDFTEGSWFARLQYPTHAGGSLQ